MSKKILSKEEEADEIIRRLSTPPPKRPRLFQAHWTLDEVNDLKVNHGLYLEEEIAKVLAMEIDKEILAEMNRRYGKGTI